MCQFNVNIPETETIKLVRTYQEKRRRKPIKKMMDMVVPGKRRRGRPRLRWIDNNREDMNKYELTADMNEKDSTGKLWRRLAHKDVEMVSKGEKVEKGESYAEATF